ncbi:DUF2474 domain-containing protein [Methylobacterium radiotolerans]|uniref:DUF2474 domain-containing protein n=1 Tax=Methylobacterium oryzae TaxID=334852 RepID=A0ABU7TNF5_9HYPH
MAPAAAQPLWKRLAWFVGLWASSIVGLGFVATVLRYWLKS